MSTPEYTKKAIKDYQSKFELIQIRLPKGTKERYEKVKKDNITLNTFAVDLVTKELERLEALNNTNPDELPEFMRDF